MTPCGQRSHDVPDRLGHFKSATLSRQQQSLQPLHSTVLGVGCKTRNTSRNIVQQGRLLVIIGTSVSGDGAIYRPTCKGEQSSNSLCKVKESRWRRLSQTRNATPLWKNWMSKYFGDRPRRSTKQTLAESLSLPKQCLKAVAQCGGCIEIVLCRVLECGWGVGGCVECCGVLGGAPCS